MIRVAKVLILALLLTGCAQQSGGLLAMCHTHFEISGTVPPDYVPEIMKAMQVWNDHLKADAFSATYPSEKDGDRVNHIYWDPNWADDPNKEAVNALHILGNQIIKTDISVNSRNYAFSTTSEIGTVHVESLFIHELGHSLGFGHIEDINSVMFFGLALGQIRLGVLPDKKVNCYESSPKRTN